MNVFSKPIDSDDCEPEQKNNTKKSNINYENYENSITLTKCKIPELKLIAKENKLHVSGSKPQLIERIHNYFIKCKKVVFIQKLFRGHIVKRSFKIRGPAFKNRKLCVNETDFYTLEPLEDIPYEEFYSYVDEKKFIYGFNIQSLIALFKQKGKIINPYNREKVDYKIINEIFSLYHLCKIIFPTLFKPVDEKPTQQPPRQLQNTVISNNRPQLNTGNLNNNITNIFTPHQIDIHRKLVSIREKSIEVRIQELFMEIDLLGNYTQGSWFGNLEKRDLIRYYRYLYDIWNYRGHLSHETKRRICSLYDPFLNNNINLLNINSPTEDYRRICLNVIETMVYTGIDVEFQKIGTLHVLSALTLVSPPARQNMIWLYESLAY
jgi:hypothetical protein